MDSRRFGRLLSFLFPGFLTDEMVWGTTLASVIVGGRIIFSLAVFLQFFPFQKPVKGILN